ncbi:HGxxPAAW family protein [Yinghuangia seranimata]|uniref:HGxxPAAW family protein n=1 Tax=Yinghuangia seranimata TaxID=408067 RepID=UPI00248C8EDA|nr:HGxxPAAW family protein [Yinghuangia seranimata]MDI2125494.1 HGxxPAAW family protein [Yinghuangia seranimata]
MPTHRPAKHYDKGSSPAGWTTVVVILAGVLVAAAAIVLDHPWLVGVGAGVALVGALAGHLLAWAGWGDPPSFRSTDDEKRNAAWKAGRLRLHPHRGGPDTTV